MKFACAPAWVSGRSWGESHELLLLNSWDDIKQDVIWLPTPYNGLTEPTFNNKFVSHISTLRHSMCFMQVA